MRTLDIYDRDAHVWLDPVAMPFNPEYLEENVSETRIWILRDVHRCSGCRLCEVACSLRHENAIWPEASRIRIFEPVPGVCVPHLCAQCPDYPCVHACKTGAMEVDERTGAVVVDEEKCVGCGECVEACPGSVPVLHPTRGKALVCDLCGGEPACVEICSKAGYGALRAIRGVPEELRRVYAADPLEIAERLCSSYYGELVEGP